MVVVKCLILCSKFTKNRLSAGLCPDPLGEFTALPLAGSWRKGGERNSGRAGREKKERGGKQRGGEGAERYPRMKILAHTPGLHLTIFVALSCVRARQPLCPSVHSSRAGIGSKLMTVGSRSFYHRLPQRV